MKDKTNLFYNVTKSVKNAFESTSKLKFNFSLKRQVINLFSLLLNNFIKYLLFMGFYDLKNIFVIISKVRNEL